MDKKSAADISQVIQDAASALRSVTEQRDHYMQKCAQLERRKEAEKLATVAHGKGLYSEYSPQELADIFEKEAAEGKLPEIQRAVDMVTPNMDFKLASVSDDETSAAVDGSDLERYIHGEIG